ncbi:uncharacterized protein LOC142985980 [Anticarsia gemmatalis]|uniref:uncharacterized protein LOC142985978 n=1 Tax=Anticarsia gemmatalis TaxID=129554 RepID=UPI003F76C8D5
MEPTESPTAAVGSQPIIPPNFWIERPSLLKLHEKYCCGERRAWVDTWSLHSITWDKTARPVAADVEVFRYGFTADIEKMFRMIWVNECDQELQKIVYCGEIILETRRHNPDKHYQLMGDLPEARCNRSRPFYNTGVDYTGFIDIKTNKGRGVKTTKGYVTLFVCMATKAVHLELVSDLTTSAFLAALRRMAARRGTPRHIFSDNGTNFLGANHVLQQQYQDIQEQAIPGITAMEIEWHFNAPSWPSAGGLWEAGVKSLKHHMRRVIGDQKLTYEELATILAQIEACLNSRPLGPMSEDPEDLDVLTPSHFLASGPNLTIYDSETNLPIRWQLAQKI